MFTNPPLVLLEHTVHVCKDVCIKIEKLLSWKDINFSGAKFYHNCFQTLTGSLFS